MGTQAQILELPPQTCSTPLLNVLVQRLELSLERHRRDGKAAESAAEVLRPFLGDPRLLLPAQCEPDPLRYRTHVLYAADDGSFSVVALVWLPGQGTPIHDHVSWCVVGVHQGEEREIQYERRVDGDRAWLVPQSTSTSKVGSVGALNPPGDIHRVVNPGPGLAISIHVYGADIRRLGSSIRRVYDHEIRVPEAARVA
jgi:predicted metal-dependent enzyme (double-stranded beta helix superfamily)